MSRAEGRAEGRAGQTRIPAARIVFGRVAWTAGQWIPITRVAVCNDMEAPESIEIQEWIFAVARGVTVLADLECRNWSAPRALPCGLTSRRVERVHAEVGVVAQNIQRAVRMKGSGRVVTTAQVETVWEPWAIHACGDEELKAARSANVKQQQLLSGRVVQDL